MVTGVGHEWFTVPLYRSPLVTESCRALNKITPEKYNELFQQMWEDLNEFNLYDVDDDDAMNVLDQVIGMVCAAPVTHADALLIHVDTCVDTRWQSR